MATLRQRMGVIGAALAESGFQIEKRAGEEGFALVCDGLVVAAAPPVIQAQLKQWTTLQAQARFNRRAPTRAEMNLLDARLHDKGYLPMDGDERVALEKGDDEAEAILDDMEARLGVFTSDVSAAMSGEEPGLAFDGPGFPSFRMHALDLLHYYAIVRRGNHPYWGGDCVLNSDTLLSQFAVRPEARAVLAEIEAGQAGGWGEVGLSPHRASYVVARIREALPVVESTHEGAVRRYVTGVGVCWMEDGEIVEVDDEDDTTSPRP